MTQTDVEEEPGVRPFAEFLIQQANGTTHAELSEALHKLVAAVRETGKATARLTLKRTPAWERWTARDNQLLQQTVFAEHVEDSLPDITEPDGATMLEIAQSFQARTNVRFESSRMLQSGQRQLVYQEETTTAAGEKGTLEVPKEMVLGLAPFEVGDLYKVTARIRFRITNGSLTIGYKLDRPDDILRQAFSDVVSEVQSRTGMNVLYGTPASTGRG